MRQTANTLTGFNKYADRFSGFANIAMEVVWLSAILLVPLIFSGPPGILSNFTEPKQNIVHVTSLILLSLLAFKFALYLVNSNSPSALFTRDLKRTFTTEWRSPYKIALALLGLYAVGNVITLLSSQTMLVSFLGRNTNEPGADFYTLITSIIFCAIVATQVRSRAQLDRILLAVAASGGVAALYGLAQVLQLDPLPDLVEYTIERVNSTFGNPLFFSSYLLMSIFTTIIVATIQWEKRRYWVLPIAVILTTLSAFTIFSTGSRGPFVALASGAAWIFFFVSVMNTTLPSVTKASTWPISRAVMLALILPLTWLIGDLAGAGVMFIIGNAVALVASLAVMGFEWRDKRNTILTAVFAVIITAAYTVNFFIFNENSGFVTLLIATFAPYVTTLIYILINRLNKHWALLRVIALAAVLPVAWLANDITGASFSRPFFNDVAFYLGGNALAVLVSLAVIAFEWRETRKNVLAIVFGGLTITSHALNVFIFSENSIIVDLLFAMIPYGIMVVYLSINRLGGAGVEQAPGPIKFKGSRPSARARARAQQQWLRKMSDWGRDSFLGQRLVIMVVAVLLTLIGAVFLLLVVSTNGFNRLNQGLNVELIGADTASIVSSEFEGELPQAIAENANYEGRNPLLLQDQGGAFLAINDITTRRLNIWRSSVEASISRVSTFDEFSGGDTPAAWRHIFGNGHDSYALAYPYTIRPQPELRLAAHPHNLLLQIWLEQGLWGLLSYSALLGALLVCMWSVYRKAKSRKMNSASFWYVVTAIGVSAVFVTHFIDQMANVTRISDYYLYWAIFGVMLVIYRLYHRQSEKSQASKAEDAPAEQNTPRRKRRGNQGFWQYGWRAWGSVGALGVSAVLAFTIFFLFDATALYNSSSAVSVRAAIGTAINDDAAGIAENNTFEYNQMLLGRLHEISAAKPNNYLFIQSTREAAQEVMANRQFSAEQDVTIWRDLESSIENQLATSENEIHLLIELGTVRAQLVNASMFNDEEVVAKFVSTTIRLGDYLYNFPDAQTNYAQQLLTITSSLIQRENNELSDETRRYLNRVIRWSDDSILAHLFLNQYRTAPFYQKAVALSLLADGDAEILGEVVETLKLGFRAVPIPSTADINSQNFAVGDMFSLFSTTLMTLGREEEAAEFAELIQHYNAYYADPNNLWLRDWLLASVQQFAGESDDTVIRRLLNHTRPASEIGEGEFNAYTSYNEYTTMTQEFLRTIGEESGAAASVTMCYDANIEYLADNTSSSDAPYNVQRPSVALDTCQAIPGS